ncbi:hypothetical protein GYMLUDRAFT_251278 [Collybiopsis luxurians FD-317 M1]|uniref:Uncharacterized protein n=1 Tax=Collybiopsis luxurians FD-317 M1 TaxID=944289 RepID=A0A0D0C3D2_9AGAR|nr:hypothetical protein GYMLUDRAFT_251278 [Collybiopsis luxurians FD-317 M1]
MEAELFPPSLRSDEGLTLAQQLGVSESPLREKRVRSENAGAIHTLKAKSTGTLKARASLSAASILAIEDSRKGGECGMKGAKSNSVGFRITSCAFGPSRSWGVGRKEKENTTVAGVEGNSEGGITTTTTSSESNGILWKVIPPSTDGLGAGAGRRGVGPRRVPLDSAEAPPVRYGGRRQV